MARRMITMVAAIVVVVTLIGFVKYRQVQAAIAKGASFKMPPEAVTTIVAGQDDWQTSLRAIGTVTAVQGVVVSADLPGVVAQIAVESGQAVAAGDVLVRLDTKQEQAQLASAEAQRDLTRLNRERLEGLRQKGVSSQAEFERAVAEAKQAVASVDEIRATIDRKTIRAPFAGVLGIRQVNLGQYVSGGAPIIQLQTLDPVYVEFSVPQQDVPRLHAGAPVTVTVAGVDSVAASGTITAIDAVVDEATRNVRVQATFANPRQILRPGMFVDAHVAVGDRQTLVAVPASSISYAPYGDSVYIVHGMTGQDGADYLGVTQQFVKLGDARGDQVAVLSGVAPGDTVVTSGVFKLHNGAAVLINNDVKVGNDPAPQPKDS